MERKENEPYHGDRYIDEQACRLEKIDRLSNRSEWLSNIAIVLSVMAILINFLKMH